MNYAKRMEIAVLREEWGRRCYEVIDTFLDAVWDGDCSEEDFDEMVRIYKERVYKEEE